MRERWPIILVCLALVGCDARSESRFNGQGEIVRLPELIEYTILEREANPPYWRAFRVRISEPCEEDELRQVAMRVTQDGRDDFEVNRVFLYLPENSLEGMPWAAAHFEPDLRVEIHGLSDEQSQALMAMDYPADGDLFGRWRDQSPIVGGVLTITEKDGTLHLLRRFQDGSVLDKELAKKPWTGGRRLQWASGLSAEDFYVLRPDGQLDIFASGKHEVTARRLED